MRVKAQRMSWWTIGIQDDEIGDQPANLVEIALDDFATARRADGVPLPTPKAFLDAFARSLLRHGVAAEFDGIEERAAGKAPVFHPGSDNADDPQLASLTDALVGKLKDCYRQHRDRDARAAELCAVVAFVLRHKPDRFLSRAKSWNLRLLRPALSPEKLEHRG